MIACSRDGPLQSVHSAVSWQKNNASHGGESPYLPIHWKQAVNLIAHSGFIKLHGSTVPVKHCEPHVCSSHILKQLGTHLNPGLNIMLNVSFTCCSNNTNESQDHGKWPPAIAPKAMRWFVEWSLRRIKAWCKWHFRWRRSDRSSHGCYLPNENKHLTFYYNDH